MTDKVLVQATDDGSELDNGAERDVHFRIKLLQRVEGLIEAVASGLNLTHELLLNHVQIMAQPLLHHLGFQSFARCPGQFKRIRLFQIKSLLEEDFWDFFELLGEIVGGIWSFGPLINSTISLGNRMYGFEFCHESAHVSEILLKVVKRYRGISRRHWRQRRWRPCRICTKPKEPLW